ncbi:hypothetical protein CXF82_20245 [Shewanella sp. GutDb-MelDb]|nr:hypothetical protein CXF82_20245 [Shewanella sp. GutDb-MelDb]
MTIYQKRLFKLDHEVIENSLTKKMNERIESAVEEIRTEYEEKEKYFESQIAKMKVELHKEVDKAKGGIGHVSGYSDLNQNYYLRAFDSFVGASFSYIKGEDNLNLRRVTNMMSDNCLPNLNKKDIEHNDDIFKHFEEVIEKLTEYNSEGIFTDQLRSLKYQFSQCKKRELVVKDAA